MGLEILFISFIIFFILSVFYSVIRSQKQIINAYSFFAIEYFVKILFSSLLVHLLTDQLINYDDSLIILQISFLFLLFIWLGFLSRRIPNILFNKSTVFFKSTKWINFLLNNLKLFGLIFLILALFLYVILAIKGDGGLLWITNSRYAYQYYRTGAGGFYVFSQLFLYLSFIFFLFTIKRVFFLKIFSLTILFVIFFSFFGSKRSILTLMLVSYVFYSYYVERINILKTSIFLIILIVIFIISQLLYSNYGLESSFLYFTYFDNMVLFLEKNPNFEFMNGKGILSSLWMLVPRELYPDKPHFYGLAYITEFIYPGSAEQGHFLGVLPWAVYYLDFGYMGVALGGWFTGTLLQYIQILFKYNKSIFVFILFVNYAVSNIFKHVPSFMLFILVISVINFLRLRINNNLLK